LSFGGYGLALAALALVVFGAYDSYPIRSFMADLFSVDLCLLGRQRVCVYAVEDLCQSVGGKLRCTAGGRSKSIGGG